MIPVPKIVIFDVLQLSHGREVFRKEGRLGTRSRLKLLLRAQPTTKITLANGRQLEDIDVLLKVLDATEISTDSADLLGDDGVGLLWQGDKDSPHVHGDIWMPGDLSHCVVLSPEKRLSIHLGLEPPAPATYTPNWALQWGTNREDAIRVTLMDITCTGRVA